MLTSGIFGLMAFLTAIGPEWAAVSNTFLLIVLAILTWLKERDARRDRERVKHNTRQAVEAVATIDRKVTDVAQKITSEHRDPNARTRKDDDSPWQPL